MLAKNAQIFRIVGATPEGLNEALAARQFVECTPHAAQSSGFVFASPDYGTFTREAGNFTEFKLRTDKKILPASVINEAADHKAGEIEAIQGYKPGRKQMKEIKEGVTIELLASAFVKTTVTRGWFDSAGWLIIDTPSAGRAEDVLDALRSATDNPPIPFPVKMWRTERSPHACMTEWVATQDPPDSLTIDDSVKLIDHNGGKVSVSQRSATSAEVIQLITESGATVSDLAMTMEDVASFIFTGQSLRRLSYLDVKDDPTGDPLTEEEQSAADLILSGDAIRKVVSCLTDAMGGEVEE